MENGGGYALLARWTSDYNQSIWKEWYYCIKNTPFELSKLKSKQRYEINKGRKYFDISVVDPKQYINDIYNVQIEAFKAYPKEYRPQISRDNLAQDIYNNWNEKIVFAAFKKSTNHMVSYSIFEKKECYIEWSVLKSIPEFERYKVNAAIIAASLEYFNQDLKEGLYIHGGERNISHQTNFQSYLEYLFDFKKIYCKLHIAYRPEIALIVHILYPFRKKLKYRHSKIFHNINAVLLMEEIIRKQKTNEHNI
ncbi:MAG: hypothetical protein HFG54_14085 [Lachnospiraceae bacterium]|nr:hypothetical protein [Lachnospiraceae bacterium]